MVVDKLVEVLKMRRPSLQCYVDRMSLDPGSCWKIDIMNAMARCRHSLCLLTDTYSDSPECMDDFHTGLIWRSHRVGYLIPILRFDAKKLKDLPDSIRQTHCISGNLPFAELADSVIPAISQGLEDQ